MVGCSSSGPLSPTDSSFATFISPPSLKLAHSLNKIQHARTAVRVQKYNGSCLQSASKGEQLCHLEGWREGTMCISNMGPGDTEADLGGGRL